MFGEHQLQIPGKRASEKPTTTWDWNRAEDILAGTPGNVVALLCPPYTKHAADGRLSGYNGLFTDAFASPKAFQSDYDYRSQLAGLQNAARLLRNQGVQSQPWAILGDWALVDLPGVRQTAGNDDEIIQKLGSFTASLRELCAQAFPQHMVLSLTELGVSKHLPLGFSKHAPERRNWLAKRIAEGIDWIGDEMLDAVMRLPDDGLEKWLSPKDYRDIPAEVRPAATVLMQTYRSIAYVRFREEFHRAAGPGELDSGERRALLESAFYDALLRYVEYQLYARLIVDRLGPSVCIYQDAVFTVAGSCLRNSDFPVLFLDPSSLEAAT
ncbi:hypothetical protein AGRA3207_007427 [Actinomadura graeca]|uniref:Uncharacterized protein n=1 Tax=Actinomadura graeca TaxID=2750812 RepID=A0ABX8R4U8_9ACTN|nr:hypothetical protein [Actinomadura graeca]QXJ25863.1 hypothetical protein AGRA3207_007427 [Actinomadura graeca]